ncbi:hypothetical protein [Streptomyces sp. NPDC002640]
MPGETYLAAADVLGRLAEELLRGTGGEACLVPQFLRPWELGWTTSGRSSPPPTSRRPATPRRAEVRELLHGPRYGLDRSVEQIVGDLQRVMTVPTLDIPAVRTPADVILTHSMPVGLGVALPGRAAEREAAAEVRAAWAAAGPR